MSTGRYHWSNCALPARFFKINAVTALPWLAVILHPSWITFHCALLTTGVFIYVEIVKKMTIMAFVRSINLWMTGRVRSTMNLFKEFVG